MGKKQISLVVSDLHFPDHDPRFIDVFLQAVTKLKPANIYLAGDLCDIKALSRFPKHPSEALGLLKETTSCKEFLYALRKAAGKNCRIVFIEGNHEARVYTYCISKAPELLDFIDIRLLLDLEKLNIEYVPSKGREAYVFHNDIAIGHFNKVAQKAGYTVTALMDKHYCSVIQGHVHRTAKVEKTCIGGRRFFGIESGCGCITDPDYCNEPNWQQCFVIIQEVDGYEDGFIIPVKDGACSVDGVSYTSTCQLDKTVS